PAGEFMANVMASVGKFEKRQTGQRVRQALNARARAGKYNGGRLLGYRSVKDEGLVVIEAEAAIVRRIFNEFVAGRAKSRIAIELHKERVPTRTGGKWYASTITAILTNALYAGFIRAEGQLVQGEHEPIIERETWLKAENLREARVTYGGRPAGRRAIGAHLLTEGLLRCSCGARMTPETRRLRHLEYQFYRCSRAKVHPDECDQKTIRRELIDVAVDEFFRRAAHDEDQTRRDFRERTGLDLTATEASLAEAEREVAKSESRLAKIQRGWQDEIIGDDEYAAQKKQLEAELGAALAQVEQHVRHRYLAQQAISALDAELEIAKRLTAIRQAIAGEVAGNTADLDAYRATLRRLFTGFVLMSPKAREAPLLPLARQEGRCWETWPDMIDGYALAPFVREDAWFSNPTGHPECLGIRRLAVPFAPFDIQPTEAVTFT
ncbi:MAG TPA: recombinase family protein, partial [Solirubrobacteraceae bacterium]|nr:recombinase family protein [Solirubrobacteraceae bacterium]